MPKITHLRLFGDEFAAGRTDVDFNWDSLTSSGWWKILLGGLGGMGIFILSGCGLKKYCKKVANC
jgi:hypothetical protein